MRLFTPTRHRSQIVNWLAKRFEVGPRILFFFFNIRFIWHTVATCVISFLVYRMRIEKTSVRRRRLLLQFSRTVVRNVSLKHETDVKLLISCYLFTVEFSSSPIFRLNFSVYLNSK